MGKVSEEVNNISPYETVQERGKYTANGYTFEIEPVYFGEEEEYFSDNHLSAFLQNSKEDIQDKDLAQYIIALFQIKGEEEAKKDLRVLGRVKLWLVKLFKKDYRYYSENPKALGFIKWMERKVKYKGRHIRFYDLERKYKLTKIEIAKMYRYMEDLSGF